MVREQESAPQKTSYEIIKDLYEMPSNQPRASQILVEGDVKTFTLEGESSIRIERRVHNTKPWFYVSIGNILSYRIDQKEGLVQGWIEGLRLPSVNVQLGGFSMQMELLPSVYITVPKEHRQEVGEILVGWTRKSIEEGRLGNSPFKLNSPSPEKKVT